MTPAVLAVSVGIGALVAVLAVAAARRLWRTRERAGLERLRAAAARLVHQTGAPAPGPDPEQIAESLERAAGRWAMLVEERTGWARQLESIFEAMGDPILVARWSGAVVLANRALETLVGVNPGGARERTLDELFPAAGLTRVFERGRDGEAVTEQIVLRPPGGARTWEVAARPVTGWEHPPLRGEGPVRRAVAMSFRDITEAARTLSVRTDFVANASHELRTPIAAIRMALDTLTSVEDADAALRERLHGMIAGQVSRLEELAHDLLDLSRLESEAEVQAEPVALAELAPVLRARFEGVLRERRLTVEFEIDPGAAMVRTDRRLLELILGNLIDNATKFAFEGTPVRVVAIRHDGGVRLEVIDRGVGIPLGQQQRVFERFYQVDAARAGSRRGSGLGLAIVRHAVRRLGGTIRLSSVWQQGTTMTLELPAG